MADSAAKKEDSGSWMVLVTVIIGTFLGRLDGTIVNLALPKMIDAFSLTVSTAGWIATAYILANAVFVPIWGKLGDTIGRKKVYLAGFIIFIVGSVLAGLSWNFPSMIVFRIIQAVAVSADYPSAMAILAVMFRPEKARPSNGYLVFGVRRGNSFRSAYRRPDDRQLRLAFDILDQSARRHNRPFDGGEVCQRIKI